MQWGSRGEGMGGERGDGPGAGGTAGFTGRGDGPGVGAPEGTCEQRVQGRSSTAPWGIEGPAGAGGLAEEGGGGEAGVGNGSKPGGSAAPRSTRAHPWLF